MPELADSSQRRRRGAALEGGAIEAVALAGANSRTYLRAVFAAYRAGRPVVALPRGSAGTTVPGVRIVDRQGFEDEAGWFDEAFAPIRSDAAAQISFSSGTTGRPKALLLSHRALSDVVERINAAMEVDASIREYVGVPVTFSFGFGRVRAVAAAGGASFLPPHGFDPSEIARMLSAGEINAVSAVPTLWRVVLANPEVIGAAGARVRWIEIGSQYMAAEEKAAMKRLFPEARIVQHYGLTEASRTTLLDISATEGTALESVGRATGRVEIGIAPDGAIRIRGPHLADGLLTEAGVRPVADADGWLTTADRGRIEDGYLYYEGRSDELINSGGIKIDPTRFEQRLVQALGDADGLAVGRAADPLRGERVLIALRRDSGLDRREVEAAAARIAAGYGLAGAGALVVREVEEIPRTATGKVQRKALSGLPDLSAWATAPAAPFPGPDPEPAPAPASAAGKAAELQRLWAEVLGVPSVSLHESFYDLGGDSLSALTVILRMESLGLEPETARGIFDGKTIAELLGIEAAPAAAGPAPAVPAGAEPSAVPALTLAEAMQSVHATRGVLVVWVVIVHWLPGVLTRISENAVWIYDALNPVLRFGTPGFALVFGLGIGALGIPRYLSNRAVYLRSTRINATLVLSGIALLALIKAGLIWSEGNLGHPELPSALFYSAIAYYALALLALPLFMRFLTSRRNVLLTILATAVGCMLIHEILSAAIAQARPGGFLELAKILLVAKYGFFRMSAYVMVGAAIGYLFRAHHRAPAMLRDLVVAGLALITFGFLLIYEVRPEAMLEGFGQVLPWHLMVYAGAALLILGGFCVLNRGGGADASRLWRLFNAAAISTGILALPIFVGHEMVIPAKALLTNLGVPGALALLIPLGLFLAALVVAYRRLLGFLMR